MSASKEILRPINKIKTSINENDQLLWQCQSSTKCYTTATERLIEKCENIRKEIRKLEEEILEMDPQTDILASCYQVQLENLTLNQESLVIQKLHKKCIENSIKKHKDDAHQATEEYSQHIKKCKEKLEIGNPIYKSLQAKKVELLKSKIGCMELTKKISKAKGLNKEKNEIKQKLFYGDIICYAQTWLNHKNYLEATSLLEKETQKERELMRKLMNVTEELKKKQEEGCYKRNTNLRVPQIEFPKNDISINNAVKIKKTDKLEPFADIKAMLEKQDAISVNIKKFENQTAAKLLEFNANKSKIRILENKTIYPPQQVENLTMVQSKEKRSKAIAEKLQKVVQNFNKSISRQNSKKHVDEQKLFRTDTPTAKMGVDKDNVQYGASSGATQELLNMSINKQKENAILSQETNIQLSQQSSKGQNTGFSKPPLELKTEFCPKNNSVGFVRIPDNVEKKIILGENKFNIQDKSKPTPHKFEFPSRNFTFAERKKIVEHPRSANPQFGSNFFSERSQFFPSSGFGVAFNTMSKNGKDIAGHQNNRFKKPENVDHKQVFLDNDPTRNLNVQKEDNEAGEVVTDTGNFLKMPGMSYKFGNETQFSQILNESYDHEVGYLSPELNTSYINSPPADLATKESDFSSQMFSFGQSNKLFNFN